MVRANTFGDQTAAKLLKIANAQYPAGFGGPEFENRTPIKVTTVRNDATTEVPAFGCMAITGAEFDEAANRAVVIINKPTMNSTLFLFNNVAPIAVGAYGVGVTGDVRALYTTGTPAVGQSWGPVNDWVLTSGGTPALTVYGVVDTIEKIVFGSTIAGSSSVKLAQAPSGGIPARVGINPGTATCTAVIKHPTSFALVKLATTFTVYNWDFQIIGADGDRVIQVTNWANGADVVAFSCTNEADPAAIILYTP